MDLKAKQMWEDFLNPEVLRFRLAISSIYIVTFEALKDSITDHIKTFFWTGFEDGKEVLDQKYESDVLSRNRSPVHASLEWLQERKAIDDKDIESFVRVKDCRNKLAHGLLKVVTKDGIPSDFEERFQEMVALMKKIDHWWIINFEIPINSDFDGKEIDEEQIMSGRLMSLLVLYDIALGSPEKSSYYHDEFRKRCDENQANTTKERPAHDER
ncbi:MAG TPA: hypothetical protein VM008_03495 [Phycisphaerae bacterium]|nr:hypothetical protein [Phycisphaerae bacterium]